MGRHGGRDGSGSGHAWAALAAALAAGAVLAWWLPSAPIDWQPALAWQQPWRAWTAAWVHWSALHLGANLAGTVALAALGLAARLPGRAAVAWFAAWPVTQWALLVKPELAHYGGLSGVLHAGAAVAGLWLAAGPGRRDRIGRPGGQPDVQHNARQHAQQHAQHNAQQRGRGRQRLVGIAVLLVLTAKLVHEEPWGPALRHAAGWDIALAPVAHATGALAGLLCAALVWLCWPQRLRAVGNAESAA